MVPQTQISDPSPDTCFVAELDPTTLASQLAFKPFHQTGRQIQHYNILFANINFLLPSNPANLQSTLNNLYKRDILSTSCYTTHFPLKTCKYDSPRLTLELLNPPIRHQLTAKTINHTRMPLECFACRAIMVLIQL